MSSPESPFLQRPWPQRQPEESPLVGRNVLVVSPDSAEAAKLASALTEAGSHAQSTSGGAHLQRVLHGSHWELVIADWERLGPEALSAVQALASRPAILLLSAQDAEHTAPLPGVFSVLSRPVSRESLLAHVGRALERRTLEDENRRLRESLEERFALGSVITRDPAMRGMLKIVESVADTRANVLLLGESGTGKTMVAHTIHQRSSRSKSPFVVVNCGSLPDSLLESELFGHVRGAFTGAVRDKIGRFEQADGGTIFLDEINSASLDLQVKLLRVIQDKAFERVGDERTRKVDVRLITASNTDLEQDIAEGRFREDLYYRIHVVSLLLPPLRERPGDVALLADHFLARYAEEYVKPVVHIASECLSALVGFPWPGNVRQLENALERAVLLSSGDTLTRADLGQEIRGNDPGGEEGRGTLDLGLRNLTSILPLKEALEEPERQIILRALEQNGGNRQKTAEVLAVNRTTLFNKMKKYGLMDLSFGSS